jgi:hypothetical protein
MSIIGNKVFRLFLRLLFGKPCLKPGGFVPKQEFGNEKLLFPIMSNRNIKFTELSYEAPGVLAWFLPLA